MRAPRPLSLAHRLTERLLPLFHSPPRGWRSWNLYGNNVNQTLITGIMDGMVKKQTFGGGKPTSLCDLGYCDVGLDDHWQNCTRICGDGSVVPSWLPGDYQCCKDAAGKCNNTGSHVLPWYDQTHEPRVDLHRFPDMKCAPS